MTRLTVDQRRLIRNWWSRQQPRPTQSAVVSYILERYGAKLTQSAVSRLLSHKNDGLDLIETDSPGAQLKRLSKAQWPVLERILHRWQLGVEKRCLHTSKEILQSKAREIWLRYPEARNFEPDTHAPPDLGNKWVSLFQKRYEITQKTYHGELGSALPILDLPETKERMEKIKRLIQEHPIGNRYNMDQTGLYWRRTASSGLASTARSGRKLDKARISIACTNNDTGTDRFQLWVVGKAKTPRTLERFNWKGYKLVWDHNSKAWFNTAVMEKWFTAFYTHIRETKPGQKVLLLLDNFSAHHSALELCPPPTNITVEFFPANVTSIYQPCDQGIIATFKRYYKKSYLQWLLAEIDSNPNLDPVKSMSLRNTMVWMAESYFIAVHNDTIHNCWRKSTLLGGGLIAAIPNQALEDLTSLYDKVTVHIPDRIPIQEFLNPADENEEPHEPTNTFEVLDGVLEEYEVERAKTMGCETDYRDLDEIQAEACLPEVPEITSKDALLYLISIVSFSQQDEVFTMKEIDQLQKMKDKLSKAIANSSQQITLDRWLIGTDVSN